MLLGEKVCLMQLTVVLATMVCWGCSLHIYDECICYCIFFSCVTVTKKL